MNTKTEDIKKDKLDLINWITTLEDKTSLELLKVLKEEQKEVDWSDNISDEERNAIEEGLSDLKKGNTKPHSEVKKVYEKWL